MQDFVNPSAVAVDPMAFRRALGTFLTGVTVVTTVDREGRPRGMTANSFTSVSLDPPLVLVCIAKSAASYPEFLECEGFVVNTLAEEQKALSVLFASQSPAKFDAVQWRSGAHGAPIIAHALSWFDCRAYRQVDAGDHVVLIGEVTAFASHPGRPLGYCQGNYVSFGMLEDAVGRDPGGHVVFGCILNYNDQVLLCRTSSVGAWSLPTTALLGTSGGNQKAVLRALHPLGVSAEVSFLYSVYELPERGETHVYYRGNLLRPPASRGAPIETRLFQADEIPWPDMALPPTESMLRRYVKEQAADSFGVYMEGLDGGKVGRLDGVTES